MEGNDGPQAPGFLAINYGFITPCVVLIAHAVFGMIIGFGKG